MDAYADTANPTTQYKLAAKYGVAQAHISNILRRKRWKHLK